MGTQPGEPNVVRLYTRRCQRPYLNEIGSYFPHTHHVGVSMSFADEGSSVLVEVVPEGALQCPMIIRCQEYPGVDCATLEVALWPWDDIVPITATRDVPKAEMLKWVADWKASHPTYMVGLVDCRTFANDFCKHFCGEAFVCTRRGFVRQWEIIRKAIEDKGAASMLEKSVFGRIIRSRRRSKSGSMMSTTVTSSVSEGMQLVDDETAWSVIRVQIDTAVPADLCLEDEESIRIALVVPDSDGQFSDTASSVSVGSVPESPTILDADPSTGGAAGRYVESQKRIRHRTEVVQQRMRRVVSSVGELVNHLIDSRRTRTPSSSPSPNIAPTPTTTLPIAVPPPLDGINPYTE